MSVFNTGSDNHASKLTLNVCYRSVPLLLHKQIIGMGIFLKLTLIKNKYSICINNRGKSVSHNENSAVLEALAESSLNQVVSLKVQIDSGLINDQHFCLSDDSSGKTEQLFLAT